jgi:hypothetical protein
MKIDRKNQGDEETAPKSTPEKEAIMGLKRVKIRKQLFIKRLYQSDTSGLVEHTKVKA